MDIRDIRSWIVAKSSSAVHRLRTRFFRKTKKWKDHPYNREPPNNDWAQIDHDLVALCRQFPFTMADFVIDGAEYSTFKTRFWPGRLYAVGYKDKKIMEHYVSYRLLDLKREDSYIDVASENSPFPAIFQRNLGLETFSQDLSYKAGVHGNRIGSSADNMPIGKESVDKISLHCAFEHFCQDVDKNFIHELRRVLRPQGRCVIVPLYLASRHLNVIDPVSDYECIQFDPGSLVIGETDLGGVFERYYSPKSLERILIPNIGLRYEIFRIKIPESVWESATKGLDRVRYALRITRA